MEKGAFFSYDVNNREFVYEEIIDMRVKFLLYLLGKQNNITKISAPPIKNSTSS